MFNMNTSNIGKIGENIFVKYLENKGYKIIERNYRKKWGEIDVIAEKNKVLHFFEVKSGEAFSCENDIRPEENITSHKKHQLRKIIQTYLFDKKIPEEKEFQIDAGIVLIDFSSKKAKIKIIKDILS